MVRTQIFEFTQIYSSKLLRGEDIIPRPEYSYGIVIESGGSDKKLLDIGCGSAYKTLKFSHNFQEIIGLEPSVDLLSIAQKSIKSQKISNIYLVKGVAEHLPFRNNQFDVAIAILSWWFPQEVYCVLKPNGLFLIECLGPEDKKSFTHFFGKDKKGWRGANLNTDLAAMKQTIQQKLNPFFHSIEFKNILWQTSYCEEGLWMLLNNTKTTVRNFNPISDKEKFDNAMVHFKKNNQIILTQNRLIITARSRTCPLRKYPSVRNIIDRRTTK